MKYKCVIVVALSVFACFGGITTNSPLSLLRNKWGKGSIVDFRKVTYENLPLLFDEGGTVALDLDVLPEGADELLSVIYKVRRLRGN